MTSNDKPANTGADGLANSSLDRNDAKPSTLDDRLKPFAQPRPLITSRCVRCWAQHAALPPDLQTRLLLTEDWIAEDMTFIPRAMNQEQAVAAELLTSAIGRYWHAFGVECMGARLKSLVTVLRLNAKRMRITHRILQARAEINARARVQYERGDIAAAHMIEGEPTPDYPWRERDAAWLRWMNSPTENLEAGEAPAGRTGSWA